MAVVDFLRASPRTSGPAAAGAGLGILALGGVLLARRRLAAGASRAPRSLPVPHIDALLATPASAEERAELARGPRVVVERGVAAVDAAQARAFVEAMLRAAMAIRFDAPVPVLGVTCLWDYLKAHVTAIEVYFDATNTGSPSTSLTSPTALRLPHTMLLGNPRRWSDPDNGGAGVWSVVTLVHEARHIAAPTLGHLCNTDCTQCAASDEETRASAPRSGGWSNDPSLEFGGAWAAHYWTLLWLAERSGGWLSADARALHRAAAERMRAGPHFCDRRAAGTAPPPAKGGG